MSMISFSPLWDTMKEQGISQYQLIHLYGFSTGTLDALRKNRSVTLNTIQDLCNILQCPAEAIVTITPEEKPAPIE